MFGKKKRATSTNPEVQEAMTIRDDLLDKVGEVATAAERAIAEVDRLNALLQEYAAAEGR